MEEKEYSVAVDTSGDISDAELEGFAKEIRSMFRWYHRIPLIGKWLFSPIQVKKYPVERLYPCPHLKMGTVPWCSHRDLGRCPSSQYKKCTGKSI
jgi:hypothetical protein